MTKSLTEKWKDGELPAGFYYIQDYTGKCVYRHLTGRKPDADFIKCFKEVLAPVPSYEECKQLTDMDEELKNLACKNDTLAMENGKLQERIADADKALKYMDEKYGEHYTIADGTKMGNSPAWQYMLKWGVK